MRLGAHNQGATLGSGFAVYARGRLAAPGLWATLVGVTVVLAVPDLKVPVPLNEWGANAVATSLLAYCAMVPWSLGLGVDISEAEAPHRRRAGVLRLRLFAIEVALLILIVAVATGMDAHPSVARFGLACLFFLGLAGVASAAPRSLPSWLPGMLAVTGTMVFGVDRHETEPYSWAWLLANEATLRPVRELIAPFIVLLIGAVVVWLRRPRADREEG